MTFGAIMRLAALYCEHFSVIFHSAAARKHIYYLAVALVLMIAYACTGGKPALHHLSAAVIKHAYVKFLFAAFKVFDFFFIHFVKSDNHCFFPPYIYLLHIERKDL